MTYSWSHKLFLRINKIVGRYPLLDSLGIFFARFVILILFLVFVGACVWSYRTDVSLWVQSRALRLLVVSGSISFFVSYMTALVWRHPRPVRELSGIRVIVHTFGTWKSFPSDHTIGATLLGASSALILPIWLWVPYAVCALLVALSRVYVGVHYPRDIVGGFLLGSTVSLLVYGLMQAL